MTSQQISADIERGITLRKTIKESQAELKQIEKRLEIAGLNGEQIPLQESDREGRQFLARSPKLNLVVPVIFESDQIIASLQNNTQTLKDLVILSNDHFCQFWTHISKFERVQDDGQTYRKTARELLGHNAPAFIAASLQRNKNGIPKSRTVIAWEHAKPIDQIPS